jgi:hypothetical protein
MTIQLNKNNVSIIYYLNDIESIYYNLIFCLNNYKLNKALSLTFLSKQDSTTQNCSP